MIELPKEFTTATIHSIDYEDFESLVKKTYNVSRYEFVALEECRNDSSHNFSALAAKASDKSTEDFMAKDGNKMYVTSNIFNDLAKRGIIPEGSYCVEVCW